MIFTDYVNIGPTPAEEDCAQVGTPDYARRARTECNRFIDVIRKKLGPEPSGAELRVKGFDHDFGRYYDVVCFYDEASREAMEYAFRCEAEAPSRWGDA